MKSKKEKLENKNNSVPTKDKNSVNDSQQPRVKTNMTWAEPKKQQAVENIKQKHEERRQAIIDEIFRIRNTPKENGKYPTLREIEAMLNYSISRTEIGDILNGKANAKHLAKRIGIKI